MDFIEQIWIGQERAEAGLRAKIDYPVAIPGARKISGVSILEDPSAERHKTGLFLFLQGSLLHIEIRAQAALYLEFTCTV